MAALNKQARKPITKKAIKNRPKYREDVKTIVDKRMEDFPDNSLTKVDNKLYCQACCQNVNAHKGNCKVHITSKGHKTNVKAWRLNKTSTKTQKGMKDTIKKCDAKRELQLDSMTAAAICGIQAKPISRYNKLLQRKYKFKFGSALVWKELQFLFCKTLCMLNIC